MPSWPARTGGSGFQRGLLLRLITAWVAACPHPCRVQSRLQRWNYHFPGPYNTRGLRNNRLIRPEMKDCRAHILRMSLHLRYRGNCQWEVRNKFSIRQHRRWMGNSTVKLLQLRILFLLRKRNFKALWYPGSICLG